MTCSRCKGFILLPLYFSTRGLARRLGSSRSQGIGVRGAVRDKKSKDNIWQGSVWKNKGWRKRREQETTNRQDSPIRASPHVAAVASSDALMCHLSVLKPPSPSCSPWV